MASRFLTCKQLKRGEGEEEGEKMEKANTSSWVWLPLQLLT